MREKEVTKTIQVYDCPTCGEEQPYHGDEKECYKCTCITKHAQKYEQFENELKGAVIVDIEFDAWDDWRSPSNIIIEIGKKRYSISATGYGEGGLDILEEKT